MNKVVLFKVFMFVVVAIVLLCGLYYWPGIGDDLLSTVGYYNPKEGVKNIAVCIVGQAGRLEYASKVENLISINAQKSDVKMFVVGVLDRGALYSDILNRVHSTSVLPVCYNNGTDMEKLFHRHFAVPNVTVKLEMSSAVATFPLSKYSLAALQRYRRRAKKLYLRTMEARVGRIQNHLRQFNHDAICHQQVLQLEEEHGLKMDVIVRLRDNALVLQPFDIHAAMEKYYYRKILAKDCYTWGGYADKVWVIPRKHFDGAMSHITADVVSGAGYLQFAKPKNSERLVKTVWTYYGVSVVAVPPEELPIADGRCTKIGTSTVAPQFVSLAGVKDCVPK